MIRRVLRIENFDQHIMPILPSSFESFEQSIANEGNIKPAFVDRKPAHKNTAI